MRRWLLPWVAAADWGGIWLAGLWSPRAGRGFVLLAAGCLVLVMLVPLARADRGWRAHGVRTALVVGTAFMLLGGGWATLCASRMVASPLRALAGHAVVIAGSASDDAAGGDGSWSFPAHVSALALAAADAESTSLGGAVWVEGRGQPPPARAGDRVQVIGILELPRGDFGRYLGQRGFAAILRADRVSVLGPANGLLAGPAQRTRQALGASLQKVFPEREAGLLMGLILGDTSRMDPQVDESFRATGLTHLLAVSGENLAMFLAPLLALTLMVHAGRWTRLAVGLGGTAFFVTLARAEPSVVRAAAMATISLLGVFLGRPREGTSVLAGATIAVLALDPTLVYSVGFQLSVAATFGMVTMATPIADRLRALPKGFALAVGTTTAAQVGVTPILLHDFGAVPTVTLLANVLAYPAVGPGMLLGLASAAVAIPLRPAGALLARLAVIPLGYLEWVARALARSPFPTITSTPGSVAPLALGTSAIVLGVWWATRRRRRRARVELDSVPGGGWSRTSRFALVVCLVVPLIAWTGARSRPPPAFSVTFFDVGQGNAALVRSPSGAAILIDGGPDPQEVARKLAALSIHRLDVVVATHPHADHVVGLPAVLARIPVGLILDPGCAGDAPAYRDFLRAAGATGAPFQHPRPGATYRVGDVLLEVLGPEHCYAGTDSDPNNDSLILRVSDGADSVLFPGDAEKPSQEDVLRDEAPLLSAEVLKVPHHGGATSTPQFLAAVGARLAVVSVGQPNPYGHPSSEIMDDLVADGMEVMRTDQAGDITVAFQAGTLRVASADG